MLHCSDIGDCPQHFQSGYWMVAMETDWLLWRLIGWKKDWLVAMETDWLLRRLTCCYGDWLVATETDWLLWRLTGCYGDWLVALEADWLKKRLIGCYGDWLVATETDWLLRRLTVKRLPGPAPIWLTDDCLLSAHSFKHILLTPTYMGTIKEGFYCKIGREPSQACL